MASPKQHHKPRSSPTSKCLHILGEPKGEAPTAQSILQATCRHDQTQGKESSYFLEPLGRQQYRGISDTGLAMSTARGPSVMPLLGV